MVGKDNKSGKKNPKHDVGALLQMGNISNKNVGIRVTKLLPLVGSKLTLDY